MKNAFVYFMSNKSSSTLYLGVTNDLCRRVLEHKTKAKKGFTAKYNLTKLVYYESGESMIAAIAREKQLKNWTRQWKNELINEFNSVWRDLSADIGIKDNLIDEIAGQARNDG